MPSFIRSWRYHYESGKLYCHKICKWLWNNHHAIKVLCQQLGTYQLDHLRMWWWDIGPWWTSTLLAYYIATFSFALLKFGCLITCFCLFRFHLLAEFDADKRSCRKRLDGHNRRRRKPQPDTMASASFIASHQGRLRFYQFSLFFPSLYMIQIDLHCFHIFLDKKKT